MNGCVDVMAAGVHDAHFLAQIGRDNGRLELQVGFLGHRECVHVRSYGDDRSRSAALENGDHAGMSDSCLDFQAEGA